MKDRERSQFMREIEDRLARGRERIESLERDLSRKGEDARIRVGRELEDLRSKRDQLERQLDRARDEVGDGWESLKKDLATAASGFGGSVKRVTEALSR